MFAKMTDQQITVDSWQNIKEKTLNVASPKQKSIGRINEEIQIER